MGEPDPGGDDDAAPAPTPSAWAATPELQAFAARVIRSRRHRGLGPRAERLRSAGEAIDRFAAGREYSTTLAGRVDPRWACPERDRDDLPESVAKALKRCQKPFHLWNVERVEHEDPLAFERRDGLRVGGAALVPDDLRVPRRVEKASRALREWLEEQAFRDTMVKMDRRRFLRLLRDPLPYGRKDDEPRDDDDVVVIGPPGPGGGRGLPEHLAAFVRMPGGVAPRSPDLPDDDDEGDGTSYLPLPGPGGFDMSQPDEDDGADGDDDGGGLGGFDMSQPDDDDPVDAGDGPGGFDLSQE